MRLCLCLATLVWANVATAQYNDFVTSWGKMSDEDFYRLVTCGAAPGGGPCQDPEVRWSRSAAGNLRVRFEPVPRGFDKYLGKEMLDALDRAIAEINNAGANLTLVRVAPRQAAEISIYLTLAGDQQPITGTGIRGIDGEIIGAGLTTVWWGDDYALTEAVIVMAGDLPSPEVYPVMLEELTQSLGFLTDIRNPLYESHSVFSEDSNTVTRLGPQDLTALRRHYP
jgi:hypothetical protein